MLALVSYDIVDNKTRTRLHKFLKEFGLNTQKSVFECEIDHLALRRIEEYAAVNLDSGRDSLVIFTLCKRCQRSVAVSGLGIKLLTTEYLVL